MNAQRATYLQDLLSRIKFGTLATASPDAQPWNSPVIMVRDADFNFYWFSDQQSQHSRNVRANPRVFIVFYDSTVPAGHIKVDRGLYVGAMADEKTDPQTIAHALALRSDPHRDTLTDFIAPAPRRVYQATPTRAWINDIEKHDGKFTRDIRVELPLDELRRLFTQ